MAPEQARQVLEQAELICTAAEVNEAIDRMAAAIGEVLRERNPLVVIVMQGGVYLAGQILPRLRFPLELDYVHVSRYGDATQGGELRWRAEPTLSLDGRTVLVLDDVLDVGHTLAAVRERLLDGGADSVYCAVLTEKETGTPKPLKADFVGLKLPNRYVFGCGMDIAGAWRNLPAIYAIKEG